jgi:hypothetical protein
MFESSGVEKFTSISLDPFRGDRAFFIAADKLLMFYSPDNGTTIVHIAVPTVANSLRAPVLKTHPFEYSYLLWTGQKDCPGKDCHTETYYSRDLGASWVLLDKYTKGCQFGLTDKFVSMERDSVFCFGYEAQTGDMERMARDRGQVTRLRSTGDFGVNWKVLIEHVVGYASFEEYMVAAVLDGGSLKLFVSRDGDVFKEGKFPEGVVIPELGYTVLESTTGKIYLDVYMDADHQYGTLFISDIYTGLSYSQSLAATNRDGRGFVDFEKVQGIKGVALMNEIKNLEEVKKGMGKQLVTKITNDDGETWGDLKAPGGGTLHLHAFTQRRDQKDMYSSKTAIGMLVAVGSVGDYLKSYNDCASWVSRDAGASWRKIQDDAYMFEVSE